jgi:hypothetical protein
VNSKNCGKQILDAGGKVVEILSDGTTTRATLESWITSYNLNISSFTDSPIGSGAALTAAGIRETVFVIEMPSMKIVYVVHGNTAGIPPSSIVGATNKIFTLLNKGTPQAPCK